MCADQMFEGGNAGPKRACRLGGLSQLLRIPEQHEGRRSGGDSDRIGQGELAGLVDHEHVDGRAHVLTRPQPRAPPDEGATVS